MRPSSLLRLWSVLAVGAFFAGAIPSCPIASREAVAAAAGGTVVSVDGSTVNIIVNLDLCCAADASEQTVYGSLIAAYARQAEGIWNAALAKLRYGDCFTLHLSIQPRLLTRGDRPTPGSHQVAIDFKEPGRPGVFDPTTSDTNADTGSAYTQPLTGDFYFDSMDGRTWAHEIGHLMGLGDDYIDSGVPKRSHPLPGRSGTLMDSGADIDQYLVNRIGDVIGKTGYRLPRCWSGTLDADVSFQHDSRLPDALCSGTWSGSLKFVIEGTGKIDGEGTAQSNGQPSCQFAGFPDANTSADFKLEGNASGSRITLHPVLLAIHGPHDYAGFTPAFSNRDIELTAEGKTIEQTVAVSFKLFSYAFGHGSLVFHLQCRSCAAKT